MTFYLKYRPQTINDLDIESVRDALSKIVEKDQIPHALLFAGTKGTGKTSAARILAKIINCDQPLHKASLPAGKASADKPCNECESCISITNGTNIDVIELDAASNRGIDDIRILRDAVKLAPISARAKVYIIDEAHMLTTEASNALLKTLEEPPAHVYFMLATTNPEKLIETIRSRTTLIKFTKATQDEVIRSLKRIVKLEKLKITDTELVKIYEMSHGSFRDAVKMLESFSVDGKFTETDELPMEEVLSLIAKKEQELLLSKSADINIESLLSAIHKELLAEIGIGTKISSINKDDLTRLIDLLLKATEQAKYSPIEELPLQLAFIKYMQGQDTSAEVDDSELKKKDKPQEPVKSVEKITVKYSGESTINSADWDKVLKAVRPVNASIEALLRASKPLGFDGKSLQLGVYYKFHKERLDDLRNKKLLEDVIASIFNNPVRVDCTLTEIPPEAIKKVDLVEPQTAPKEPDITQVAQDIFS
jgi:DNA polymerase-3 subunit gamma/tau